MLIKQFDRRRILAGAAGLAAAALPRRAYAADQVVAAIAPGPWEESFRKYVVPAGAKVGLDVQLAPGLSLEQVAKVRGSRGSPPFDVVTLDPGPRGNLIDLKLVEPFDPSRLTNLDKLPAGLADQYGVATAGQVCGIAYNPKKLPRPTGWKDLFRPEFVKRLGITGFQSTYGTAALIEISKAYGGSENDIQPALDQIARVLPDIAAVAQPVALPQLFQQGQIDVMYMVTQFVDTFKSQGVDIEFVIPDTGAIAFYSSMHIPKGAKNVDAAYRYIDIVLSRDIQAALAQSPYYVVPVNKDAAAQATGTLDLSDKTRFISHDWVKINPMRPEWIDRFNKTVAR